MRTEGTTKDENMRITRPGIKFKHHRKAFCRVEEMNADALDGCQLFSMIKINQEQVP